MITDKDIRCMEIAVLKALKSGCISTKVGALLISQNGRYVSCNNNQAMWERCDSACGHLLNENGKLPADARPKHSDWSDRNEVHAEMMCFMDAHRQGIVLQSATMYTTTAPCHQCTKHIAFYAKMMAISRVVYLDKYDRGSDDWIDRLSCHGVVVEKIERNQLTQSLRDVKLTNIENSDESK